MSLGRALRTTFKITASVLLLWAGAESVAIAAPKGKIDFCHFQPGTDSWKKTSIAVTAVPAHFAHHDDATPGGTTSKTGTQLDGDCSPDVAACGNCLSAVHGVGCQNDLCEATICFADPFCCITNWDSICVDEALDLCADEQVCTVPVGG